MHCSLPRSSVHGDSLCKNTCFPPGDPTKSGVELGSPALQVDSLPAEISGKPTLCKIKMPSSMESLEEFISILLNVNLSFKNEKEKPHCWAYTEETRIERDMYTPMFIAAVFIIARTWKQPRCPSVDEWIRKLWYIHTMEYYAAIKKNTFESVLMRWMKLEPIIQSEASQKEKHQYSILTHIYGI